MSLSARSVGNLKGVHPDLFRVIESASDKIDFIVTEGLRSLDRQKQLMAAGKSKTLKSRHLTGHAVDVVALVDGKASYADADMSAVAMAIRLAASQHGIPIEWGAAKKYGGDFPTFHDSPHFQLPVKAYPAEGAEPMKPVTESMTMRANTVVAGFEGFQTIDRVRDAVIAGRKGPAGFDWFAFIDLTIFNSSFWIGVAALVGTLIVYRERWSKGDLVIRSEKEPA